MYKSPQAPQIAFLTWGGTPNAQNYTYTMSLDQETQSFLTINANTDIILEAGHYSVTAYPDYTRGASSDTNAFYWFLDGNQIGSIGGSDYHSGLNTDNAEAAFTIESQSTLTLQQVNWVGGAVVPTNHSKAVLMRVPL